MEQMVQRSPARQRRLPCKTNKQMFDEAVFVAALTYLLTPMHPGKTAAGTRGTPSTASGGGPNDIGQTPCRRTQCRGFTWMAGNKRNSSHSRRAGITPPRRICAPSAQSSRSGDWQGACHPPSTTKRKHEDHVLPSCARSSAHCAAPRWDLPAPHDLN